MIKRITKYTHCNTGIQIVEITTRTTTVTRPTINNSLSVACFLNLVHISIVKMVDEELNIDVNDDITAAIITDTISPAKPVMKKKNNYFEKLLTNYSKFFSIKILFKI